VARVLRTAIVGASSRRASHQRHHPSSNETPRSQNSAERARKVDPVREDRSIVSSHCYFDVGNKSWATKSSSVKILTSSIPLVSQWHQNFRFLQNRWHQLMPRQHSMPAIVVCFQEQGIGLPRHCLPSRRIARGWLPCESSNVSEPDFCVRLCLRR
jgi:hypothetical protein